MKILIIEDEPEMRGVIKQFLEDENYKVETAGNFESGLDKISAYDYDCILLDIMLPGGNGLDLLQELRKLNKANSVI
ncbi:MAG: response regulator, partial [Bacteroidales bacterium]|nr:response regulator [Bacteroidales bacterium]